MVNFHPRKLWVAHKKLWMSRKENRVIIDNINMEFQYMYPYVFMDSLGFESIWESIYLHSLCLLCQPLYQGETICVFMSPGSMSVEVELSRVNSCISPGH
ncbi:hypothetical protein AALO_G00029630 [Alosa alosa]|uniref:Uncharacterized protein n=1 Tax=Alosa alosa TaxID=278164 RepID=A0AAV6HDX8_9TELE|nr:hypothetical protein AALO_G00029630 [Alosa alosa]